MQVWTAACGTTVLIVSGGALQTVDHRKDVAEAAVLRYPQSEPGAFLNGAGTDAARLFTVAGSGPNR
jgi:hypothetical protein